MASPYHYHKNCEHFYFIMEGQATVGTPEGVTEVGPGDMVFIPAGEKHRLRSITSLFYFGVPAPNRFQTDDSRRDARRPAVGKGRRQGLGAERTPSRCGRQPRRSTRWRRHSSRPAPAAPGSRRGRGDRRPQRGDLRRQERARHVALAARG
ncbi:MAG: cupin domain-containing protein [Betaproteobacteria bacterium]|nr:cupin domain-containing protein [Betaproteobacteria bacterium]